MPHWWEGGEGTSQAREECVQSNDTKARKSVMHSGNQEEAQVATESDAHGTVEGKKQVRGSRTRGILFAVLRNLDLILLTKDLLRSDMS